MTHLVDTFCSKELAQTLLPRSTKAEAQVRYFPPCTLLEMRNNAHGLFLYDRKAACESFLTYLGGGGEDILLCEAADVLDTRGVRLSFRMAASAAPVLN